MFELLALDLTISYDFSRLNFMNGTFSEIELKQLDLNALLTFTALMRERSVTRASHRLMVGPPAVSMTLARLRETFDDPLFVRAGRDMVPTVRAEALFARIEPALSVLGDTLRNPGSFNPATATRTLRFASPDDLEITLVPALLKELSQRAPGIQLIIRAADFRNVPSLLDKDEVDVALTATPPFLEKRHRFEEIYEEDFSAVFSPRQTKLSEPLTLDDYLATPQVLLSTRGDIRGPIDTYLATINRTRNILASVPRFSTVPFILKSRRSLVNMPTVAARHYAKQFKLRAVPLPFASPTFRVSLLWQLRAEHDPAVAWFRELVRECVITLRS